MKNQSNFIYLFIVLLGLSTYFSSQVSAQAPNWSQQSSSPYWQSGRTSHGMAYLGGDKLLIFGGMAQGRLQDTYVYDLSANSYEPRPGNPKPDHRMSFGMAHISSFRVLLFGGDLALGDWGNDTWLYDGSWTQLTPQNQPSARRALAMSYIGDDKVLLFGGQQEGTAGNSNETWIFDLSDGNWTLMEPATSPPGLMWHAMAYLGGDQVVLFGGSGSTPSMVYSDATWVYDLSDNNWVQKNPSNRPAERRLHDMTYLSPGRVVLYGGYVPGNPIPTARDATWIYNIADNSWTELADISNPGERATHAMSEIGMQGFSETVLFSGSVGDTETWVFRGLGLGPQCSDGIDNDGDGAIDYPDDSLCAGTTDISESRLCFYYGKNPPRVICIAQIVYPAIAILGALAAGLGYRRWRSKKKA